MGLVPDSIRITTTDPTIIQWATTEITKVAPAAKVVISTATDFYCTKVQNRGEEILWQVTAILCQNGWEPFAADQGMWFLRRETTRE
jgi:hypothetical protein